MGIAGYKFDYFRGICLCVVCVSERMVIMKKEQTYKDPSLHVFGIATIDGFVVCLGLRGARTLESLRLIYWRRNTKGLSHEAVYKNAQKKVGEVSEDYGCFVEGYTGRICTSFSEKFKPLMWERIVKFERDGQMYYLKIDGKMEGFTTMRIRDLMFKIITAAKEHLRVRVLYLKKGNDRVVRRDIAAYSFEDGYLNVTDTRHGNKKIRSYIAENIKSAVTLKSKFKPEWLIEL